VRETGPAKRNDRTTIEAHQLFLSDKTNQLFIKIITQSIQDHGKSYKINERHHDFYFDVDGVLTDSSVLVTTEGEILRTMNIRDGYDEAAVESGYNVYHLWK
jgi:hypothetical protein